VLFFLLLLHPEVVARLVKVLHLLGPVAESQSSNRSPFGVIIVSLHKASPLPRQFLAR
jgi:hypothetical protein